jgi:hypothetical protein
MSTQQEFKVNGVSYRLLTRKCGKRSCRCNQPGQGHGPYWYAFDGNGGGGKYIGAKLPESVTKHAQLLKASSSQIKKAKDQARKRITQYESELDKARRELRALDALERGEYAAPVVLEGLGFGKLVVASAMKG